MASKAIASINRTHGKGLKIGTRRLLAMSAIHRKWPSSQRNVLARYMREKKGR